MVRKIIRHRIFYNDNGNIGGTYFVGGKKTMQKRLKQLRKGSKIKWSLRPVIRNAWIAKK